MSNTTVICPQCHGARVVSCGKGYYGEQAGDAGQLKPVWSPCPQCKGTGEVPSGAYDHDEFGETPLTLGVTKEGYRSGKDGKPRKLWAVVLGAPDRKPMIFSCSTMPHALDRAIERAENLLNGLRKMRENYKKTAHEE